MKKTLFSLLLLVLLMGTMPACSLNNNLADSYIDVRDDYNDINEYIEDDYNDTNEYIENDVEVTDNYINDYASEYEYVFDLPVNETTCGVFEEFDSVNLYEMYVPASGLVEMYFSSNKSDGYDGSFYAYFENTDGSNLWSDESFSVSDEEVLLFRNRLGEGNYYLKVYSDDLYVVEESFNIYPKYIDESCNLGIEQEQNDTEETATKVEIGMEITGNINTTSDSYIDYEDVDYYCFELFEEKVLRLDMRVPNFSNSVDEYDLSGAFGNYDVSGSSLSTLGQDFRECHTKTVRLEPGIYYFSFSLPGSVTIAESVDYYFTITEC